MVKLSSLLLQWFMCTLLQIKHIPFGSYHHVFTEPAYPDSDLVFYQILRKMGFGNSAGHLDFVWEDENIDKLGAGITAILASEKVQG